jgi:hypothetical protein
MNCEFSVQVTVQGPGIIKKTAYKQHTCGAPFPDIRLAWIRPCELSVEEARVAIMSGSRLSAIARQVSDMHTRAKNDGIQYEVSAFSY